MARLPVPGADNDTWGDILNDFLAQVHASDGQLKVNSVGTSQIQDNAITSVQLDTTAITKADVGLGNVDNTSDAAKPVSTAAQTALNGKVDTSSLTTKGSLLTATATNTPAGLAPGNDGRQLTVDSSQSTGLAWQAPSKTMQIKISDDATALTSGSNKVVIVISEDLNGFTLTKANAYVSTASSSGLPTVQIRNVTNGNANMLSTPITIDANENTSYTAATPSVINGTQTVTTGHLLAVDVSSAGTGAMGLGVILQFTGA